jgi:photosynthetic reaction center cytochrome c subunit
MKLNILRLLVVTLACASAVLVITNTRAQKSLPVHNEFAVPLSILGMTLPSQTPAAPTTPAAQEKTVEQVQKNIKILNGMPQSQLIPAMNFMAASLGVRCNYCHVNKNGQWDYPADDKEEKLTARVMIKMVLDINKTTFPRNPDVSCYTCHRGRTQPTTMPLPLALPSPRPQPSPRPTGEAVATPSPTPAGPTADQILAKYLDALGGLAAIDKLKTLGMKGTYTGANGAIPYEILMAAPDKFYINVTTPQGTIERGFDGKVGWEKGGRGVNELVPAVLEGLKQMFLFYSNIKLKEQFTQMRVGRRDKIGDREVITISGRTVDNRREQLFFDAQSGLLLRRIRYTQTMIGVIPEQTDFDDYRDVEGVKFPFTVKVAAVEVGNPLATRSYTEIRFNVPIDDSKFKMPAAPAKPSP